MSEMIFDGVRIDEDRAHKMFLKIQQAEYNNENKSEKDKLDDSKMVTKIINIIKEEENAY